jgi:uncharacterized protein YjbI with pentapeptide repeats
MSDTITPITLYAAALINDAFALRTYNGLGLSSTGGTRTGNPRDVIVDQVTLSEAARNAVSTNASSSLDRTAGLAALHSGATNFNDVDLSGAAFVGQILDGAVFSNSILRDVNFVGASLRGAIFNSSVVDGARFNQADLSGANLLGAQGLVFSQIQGATTDAETLLPEGVGNRILG